MKNKYYLQLLEGFTEWLERLNYAKETIKGRKRHLKYFLSWLTEKGVSKLEEIEIKHLEAYNTHLHQRPICSKTIEDYLSTLKKLNEYLESYGHAPVVKTKLLIDKDIKIERTILTKSEVTKLYEACENTLWGMRDRVILSIFYGCGLRSREGTNIELDDIDFNDGLVHVRKGKNYKERYVPMSSGVMKILSTWIEHGHYWFSGNETTLLLPNSKGKIADGKGLNNRLKLLCQAAEIDKRITLHCLRHSIATHFLQNGMDLESISQFLGHQGMEATTIYTRIVEENDEGI